MIEDIITSNKDTICPKCERLIHKGEPCGTFNDNFSIKEDKWVFPSVCVFCAYEMLKEGKLNNSFLIKKLKGLYKKNLKLIVSNRI